MLNISLEPVVATLAVVAGFLASPGPVGAISYNGHAGLGAAVYQHNHTDLELAHDRQGAARGMKRPPRQ